MYFLCYRFLLIQVILVLPNCRGIAQSSPGKDRDERPDQEVPHALPVNFNDHDDDDGRDGHFGKK